MKQMESFAYARNLAAAGLVGIVALGAAGCSESDPEATQRAEASETWTPEDGSDLVFDGRITYKDGTWSLNCYAVDGTLNEATAESGDTLLTLASDAGSKLIQPVKLGAADIPADVYAVALAEMNGLENQDEIMAGTTYVFPDHCELG